jgi:hypothetical protein
VNQCQPQHLWGVQAFDVCVITCKGLRFGMCGLQLIQVRISQRLPSLFVVYVSGFRLFPKILGHSVGFGRDFFQHIPSIPCYSKVEDMPCETLTHFRLRFCCYSVLYIVSVYERDRSLLFQCSDLIELSESCCAQFPWFLLLLDVCGRPFNEIWSPTAIVSSTSTTATPILS